MGEDALELQREQEKFGFKTQNKPVAPPPPPPPPQSMVQQQQSRAPIEDNTQLMAWAIEQDGKVAIPETAVYETYRTEKRFAKPDETVVEQHTKEVPKSLARAQLLQEKMPALYAKEGTEGLVELAGQEVETTFGDRLEGVPDQGLELLDKLSKAQKQVDPAVVEQLRGEMQSLGLETGEECIPYAGVFTDSEALVLMTANLSHHLLERMERVEADQTTHSAAYEGMLSVAHTTNTYANAIVAKVTKERSNLIEVKRRDALSAQERAAEEKVRLQEALEAKLKADHEKAQRQLARVKAEQERKEEEEKRKKALARQALIDNDRRKGNLERIAQVVAQANISQLGEFLDQDGLDALQAEVAYELGAEVMKADLAEGAGDETAYLANIEATLAKCQTFINAVEYQAQEPQKMKNFLGENGVPEAELVLYQDQREFRLALRQGQAEARAWFEPVKKAVDINRKHALDYVKGRRDDLTEQQRLELVQVKMKLMPDLFSTGSKTDVITQMGLFLRYQQLYAPQLAGEMAQTQADNQLIATSIPQIEDVEQSQMIEDLALAMCDHGTLHHFLPEADRDEYLLNVVTQYLKAKGTPFADMKPKKKATLVQEMLATLEKQVALVEPILEDETKQVWVGLTEFLLAETPLKQLQAKILELRTQETWTDMSQDSLAALKVRNPLANPGGEIPVDYRDNEYSTDLQSKKRELRGQRRVERLDQDLGKLGVAKDWAFKGFVLEEIGSYDLCHLRLKDAIGRGPKGYESRLKEVVGRAKINQAYLEKTLSPYLFETPEAYHLALLNLGKAVVSEKAQTFQATLERAMQGLHKDNSQASQIKEMDALRKERIEGLKERFPALKENESDLRKLLESEKAQMHLCLQGEGQWLDFITPILNNALPVLTHIDKMHSSIKWFPDQLRLRFHAEIYSGNMTLEEGKEAFLKYYKELSALEIKKRWGENVSVDKSVDELLDKVVALKTDPAEQKILKDYFTTLLANSSMDEVLNLDKTWEGKKDTIGKQLLGNHNALETFLKGQTQEPARMAGFRMFARGAAVSLTESDFEKNLDQLWLDFTTIEQNDAALTALSTQTMEARMNNLMAVDAMREKAVKRQHSVNKHKDRLYRMQAGKRSVFEDADKDAIGRIPKQMKLVRKELKTLKAQNKGSEQGAQAPVPMESACDVLAEYLARKPAEELPKECTKWGVANIGRLEQAFRAASATAQMEASENLLCKGVTLALALHGDVLLREAASPVLLTSIMAEAMERDAQLMIEGEALGDQAALLEVQSLTLKKEEYDTAVSKAKTTIQREKAIDQIVKDALKKSSWSPEEQAAIQNGWQVYRYDQNLRLWKKGKKDGIATVLQEDLKNVALVDTLRAVGNRSIMESYQTKGTMESVNATSATKKEQQMASKVVATREDFEKYLSSHSDEDTLKAYNQYTVEQRLLFAFGLSMPQKLLNLQTATTGKLLQRSNAQASDLAVSALQDYIYQGDILEMEKLDYQRAIATLEGEKAKTYGVALDFVAFCTKARQETIPVNTQRLTDAQASIKAAGKRMPKRVCSTVDDLKGYIQEQVAKDHSDLNQSVQTLNDDQMIMLLVALQNRTLLDKSTIPDADNFVDQDQREDLVDQFSDNYAQALMGQAPSALLGKAVLSLQSYQVKDGIVLGDTINRSQLAKGAVERATELDVKLLQSALELVREIEQKSTRLEAIRSATKLIEKSENQGAKDSYAAHKNDVTSESKFEEYISDQIKGQLTTVLGSELLDEASSEAVGLLAAYQDLNGGQRNLFFKALASREVLDISKEGIMANRFGMRERDYVNPAGRDNLLDEFATTGNVVVAQDQVSQAFVGILSTQVDDTVDFTQNQDVVKAQTSKRTTTVDWKLFKRAIQLVCRATEERKMRQSHFELYAGAGNVHIDGEFQFKNDFLRRNLHNAGNRFTRYLGRRAAVNAQDALSDYLGDTLSEKAVGWVAGKLAGTEDTTLSAKEEEKMPAAKQLAYSENFLDVVRNARDSAAMAEGKETALGVAKDVISVGIEEISEEFSFGLDMAEHGKEVVESVVSYVQVNRAMEAARTKNAHDQALVEEAHKTQTEAEKQRYDAAGKQLDTMLAKAGGLSKSRQVDKAISAVGEALNDIGSSFIMEDIPLAETVGRVAREAAELINFARSAFNEKALVDENLQAKTYWQNRREGLQANLTQLANRRVQTYPFALAASGFENMSEYATAKGMEFVQSLLFAASKYNTMAGPKLLAETVLRTLGLKQVGKDYDTLNAKAVFDRLMGMNR